MPMQILRTNGSGPPTGLAEGQLSVEMDTKNLWVGVPTSIDASGRVQLNAGGGGIPEPTTAGNYLRDNAGNWVPGLPLAGGQLTDVTGVAGGGTGLTIRTTGATTAYGMIVRNFGTNANTNGIYIENTAAIGLTVANNGAGRGLNVVNGAGGNGIFIDQIATSTGHGISVLTRGGSTGRGIEILRQGTGDGIRVIDPSTGLTGSAIVVDTSANPNSTAGLLVSCASGQTVFKSNGGNVLVGGPTGPAVTGDGNINVAGGYYVNGVLQGGGDFLPLTGGTLDAINEYPPSGVGLTIDNTAWSGRDAITINNTSNRNGLAINASAGTGYGINISDTRASGTAIYAEAANNGVYVWGTGTTGYGLFVYGTGTGLGIDGATNGIFSNSGTSGFPLRLQAGGTDRFSVAGDGLVRVGGKQLVFGAPDSAGAGYRTVSIEN